MLLGETAGCPTLVAQRQGGNRTVRAMLASLAVHVLVLAALSYHPAPPFFNAEPSLRGNGGRGVVALVATAGISSLRAPQLSDLEEQKPLRLPPRKRRAPKAPERAAQPVTTADKDVAPGMPGYILGSVTSGFAANHDVRAAISIVAPDPPIARARLPEWIRGDVIVEVTIDEQGSVIGTRVLQTVGFGLDDIIVQTLRQWRYIPAKVDGVAVASREDVHFHFPS